MRQLINVVIKDQNVKKIKVMCAASLVMLLAGCGADPTVDLVKNGSLYDCPQKTVGQMANDFMASPKWESLLAADGRTYVNLQGGITFDDRPATALIQFLVNQTSQTFELNALEINGNATAQLVALVLLDKMCES